MLDEIGVFWFCSRDSTKDRWWSSASEKFRCKRRKMRTLTLYHYVASYIASYIASWQ